MLLMKYFRLWRNINLSITQWIARNKEAQKRLMPLHYYLKANTKALISLAYLSVVRTY